MNLSDFKPGKDLEALISEWAAAFDAAGVEIPRAFWLASEEQESTETEPLSFGEPGYQMPLEIELLDTVVRLLVTEAGRAARIVTVPSYAGDWQEITSEASGLAGGEWALDPSGSARITSQGRKVFVTELAA